MPESNRHKNVHRARNRAHLNSTLLPLPMSAGAPPAGGNGNGNGNGGGAGVYLSPTTVPFYTFDENYLKRLRAADPETTDHFHRYFSRLLHSKLRSRRLTQHVIDDLVQETFLRALRSIMADEVREPARLGAYMNTTCKYILHEHYRYLGRLESMQGDDFDVADEAIDLDRVVLVEEIKIRVRKVLARMSARDQEILRAVIFEERNKDEICHEHGVDRAYLRVLLHRALRLFKELYKKY